MAYQLEHTPPAWLREELKLERELRALRRIPRGPLPDNTSAGHANRVMKRREKMLGFRRRFVADLRFGLRARHGYDLMRETADDCADIERWITGHYAIMSGPSFREAFALQSEGPRMTAKDLPRNARLPLQISLFEHLQRFPELLARSITDGFNHGWRKAAIVMGNVTAWDLWQHMVTAGGIDVNPASYARGEWFFGYRRYPNDLDLIDRVEFRRAAALSNLVPVGEAPPTWIDRDRGEWDVFDSFEARHSRPREHDPASRFVLQANAAMEDEMLENDRRMMAAGLPTDPVAIIRRHYPMTRLMNAAQLEAWMERYLDGVPEIEN